MDVGGDRDWWEEEEDSVQRAYGCLRMLSAEDGQWRADCRRCLVEGDRGPGTEGLDRGIIRQGGQ